MELLVGLLQMLVQAIQVSHTQVVQIPTMSRHITRLLAPSMGIDGGVTAHEMMLGGIRALTLVQTSISDSINTIQSREFMKLMLIWHSPLGHWMQIWVSGSTSQIAMVNL